MKRLKYRYNKTEGVHEYKEELVKSAETTFEKLCSGVDEQTQAPAFHHDNQDPFLGSEYTIQELRFAIKNLRAQSRPRPGPEGIDCPIIRNLPNEALEILLEIYKDILRARVSQTTGKIIKCSLSLKDTKPVLTHISMTYVYGIRTDDKHAHILVTRKQ
jgi:hypothetical protein